MNKHGMMKQDADDWDPEFYFSLYSDMSHVPSTKSEWEQECQSIKEVFLSSSNVLGKQQPENHVPDCSANCFSASFLFLLPTFPFFIFFHSIHSLPIDKELKENSLIFWNFHHTSLCWRSKAERKFRERSEKEIFKKEKVEKSYQFRKSSAKEKLFTNDLIIMINW